ncbi:alpha/beta hydrolase [Candidatus Lokiarchaeum ossiferum]|uniref:alpha/beta hydrolase n=1 Tax=Candidatus Lokiarchaeum ossiferum TaxID=2951803 RepID=UPI00352C3A75
MKFYSAFEPLDSYPTELFMQDAIPFWLKGKSDNAIVICLHGHGATTYEALPIGRIIFEKKIDCAGPLLPAHGLKNIKTAQKHMGGIKMEDWIAHARKEILIARSLYSHVFIYGQSMGGAIALLLAAEGLVDACAVTAPALLLPRITNLSPFLGWLNVNIPVDTTQNSFFNEVYSFRNIKESKQLYKLSKLARRKLKLITCPVCVCHSHNDQTVNPKVVDIICRSVKGYVDVGWFDKSQHSMTLDIQAKEIGDKIGHFFQKSIH